MTYIDFGIGRRAMQIAAGDEHVCAVLDNGQLKCFGHNNQGQLGLGDTNDRGDDPAEMGDNLTAVNLGVGITALQVTAGRTHTCVLLDNGRVKCWGTNAYGELGTTLVLSRCAFNESLYRIR